MVHFAAGCYTSHSNNAFEETTTLRNVFSINSTEEKQGRKLYMTPMVKRIYIHNPLKKDLNLELAISDLGNDGFSYSYSSYLNVPNFT